MNNTMLGSSLDQMVLDFGDDYLNGATITLGDTMTATVTSGMNSGLYSITSNGTGSGIGITGNTPWVTTGYANTGPSKLHVEGDAEIKGELTLNGVKLGDRLGKIEERLNILRPNQDLEEKWEKLRELGRMYRELEAEIIDKQKLWDTLKG